MRFKFLRVRTKGKPVSLTPYGYQVFGNLYIVVYPYTFQWLQCDHGDGSIAVDAFSSKGEYLDGITACPLCLPAAESLLSLMP